MINYIIFGTSVSVVSWMVGIIFNSFLAKSKYYERLSNMNFIESRTLNKYMGIEYFKWMVKNTFFKFFNQKIKLRNGKADLAEIRKEMTLAETSHLIGFIFVLVFAIYWSIKHSLLFGIIIMIMNTLLNLYPSLLQQENKRRIDKLINRQMSTVANKTKVQ